MVNNEKFRFDMQGIKPGISTISKFGFPNLDRYITEIVKTDTNYTRVQI